MNKDEILTELFHLRKRIALATGMRKHTLEAAELELLDLLKEFDNDEDEIDFV